MAITSVGNADGSQITNFGSQGPSGSVLGAIWYNPATGGMEIQGNNGWEPYTQANGAPSPSGGGGGGGYVAPDPFAKWGGRAHYDNLISNNQAQERAILNSANESAANAQSTQNKAITQWLDSYRSGQKAIDNQAINNELAKMNGTASVQGMVSRGLKSAGSLLANRNAGDSSAVQGFGDAYRQLGQRELANVGNQYETKNRDIGLAQEDLVNQANTYKKTYEIDKQTLANQIMQEAGQSLAALDAQIANQDLPGRIAIEQRKNEVKGGALAKLSELDGMLYGGIDSTKPSNFDARRTEATKLQQAGTDLGANAFTFTDQAPIGFQQGQQPAGSSLPLFTLPRGRKVA